MAAGAAALFPWRSSATIPPRDHPPGDDDIDRFYRDAVDLGVRAERLQQCYEGDYETQIWLNQIGKAPLLAMRQSKP